jgi:hypothetical protein
MISSGSSSGSRLCLVCFDECCIQQGEEEEEEEEECEHQVAGGDFQDRLQQQTIHVKLPSSQPQIFRTFFQVQTNTDNYTH